MKALPLKFQWLETIDTPKIWAQARQHYGQLEHVGKGSNVNILKWAKEVGVSGWYKDDDIPWCGLFIAICVLRAGYKTVGSTLLAAISWAAWGVGVDEGQECFGDILVFGRTGGNHVGLYIAENKTAFLVYGGNQSNAVGFAWIAKNRLKACRRPAYKNKPESVKKIWLAESGELSVNEA